MRSYALSGAQFTCFTSTKYKIQILNRQVNRCRGEKRQTQAVKKKEVVSKNKTARRLAVSASIELGGLWADSFPKKKNERS